MNDLLGHETGDQLLREVASGSPTRWPGRSRSARPSFPDDTGSGEELRKRADAAMYEAKRDGAGVAVYSEATVDPLERLELRFHLGRPQPAASLAASLAAGVVADRRGAVA